MTEDNSVAEASIGRKGCRSTRVWQIGAPPNERVASRELSVRARRPCLLPTPALTHPSTQFLTYNGMIIYVPFLMHFSNLVLRLPVEENDAAR